MAKLTTIVSLVCLFVAASSLTSCSAAPWLPISVQISSSESSTSTSTSGNQPSSVEAVDVESSKSDDGELAGSDWEVFSEEEFGVCMNEESDGAEESSETEAEAEKPCRRMLSRDYTGTGRPHKNTKP